MNSLTHTAHSPSANTFSNKTLEFGWVATIHHKFPNLAYHEYTLFIKFPSITFPVFVRYTDGGLIIFRNSPVMNHTGIVEHLASAYPKPITFTINSKRVSFLDLQLSIDHYTLLHQSINYLIYQKPFQKFTY